jgi:hypothetical protein
MQGAALIWSRKGTYFSDFCKKVRRSEGLIHHLLSQEPVTRQ